MSINWLMGKFLTSMLVCMKKHEDENYFLNIMPTICSFLAAN